MSDREWKVLMEMQEKLYKLWHVLCYGANLTIVEDAANDVKSEVDRLLRESSTRRNRPE